MNDGARKTILLVEDEVLIALDAANTIRGFGHDVVTANTGEEAVGIATGGGPIDLILMDIDLGRGMSGPEAAELILGKKTLPIVFLTSHAEREMVEKVHGITRYGYVIKNSGDFVLKSSIEMAFELFSAHEKVIEREKLLNHSQRVSRLGHYVFDIATGRWTGSEMLDEIFGISDDYDRNVEGWLNIVHPEQRHDMRDYLSNHVLEHKQLFDKEYLIRNARTGESVWVHGLGRFEFDGAGNPVRIFGIIQDITDKKLHEKTIRDNEERFRVVVEQAGDGFELLDEDGRFIDVNERTCQMMGYSRDELLGLSVPDIDPLKEPDEFKAEFRSLIGRPPATFETAHRRKDGTEFPVEVTSSIVTIADKNFALAMVRDITERKRADEEKRLYREELERFFDLVPDMICIAGADGYFKKLNHAWEKTLGYSMEEMLSRPFESFIHPDDIESTRREVARQIGGQRTMNFINRYRNRTGDYRLLEWNAAPSIDGTILFASAMDITDRAKEEQRIADSLAFVQTVIESSPIAILTYKASGDCVSANSAAARLLGTSIDRLLDQNFRNIESWNILGFRGTAEKALQDGTAAEITAHGYTTFGKEIWIQAQFIPFNNQGEKYILVIENDILGRKLAEEKLAERSRFIETLVNLSPDILYIYDIIDKKNIYINDGIQKMLAYSAEDIERMGDMVIPSLMHPDDLAGYVESILPRYADLKNGEQIAHQYRMRHKNSGWRWLESTEIIYTRLPDGAPRQIFGVVHDITEHRQSEEALRENEIKYRTVADFTYDWEYWLDPNGNYIYNSPSCERVTGYSADEYIADPGLLERIVHPADRAAVVNHLNNLSTVREMHTMDFRLFRRDGAEIWISHQCQPVFSADGNYRGQRGSNRDITARKHAEAGLGKTLQEKEILLKELQHRVKNNLNVIYSLLGFEMDRLSDPTAQDIFNNARSRILSMAGIYERLYQQPDIERLELGQYIREFSDSLFEMYAIDAGKYRFSKKVADITLDLKRSVPLGLILNELVSNALKYAYPGGAGGEIRIGLEQRGDYARLSVSDDGRGLPGDIDPNKTASMGFMLVRLLAEQIGGSMTVSSRPGEGTTVAVEFKIEV